MMTVIGLDDSELGGSRLACTNVTVQMHSCVDGRFTEGNMKLTERLDLLVEQLRQPRRQRVASRQHHVAQQLRPRVHRAGIDAGPQPLVQALLAVDRKLATDGLQRQR